MIKKLKSALFGMAIWAALLFSVFTWNGCGSSASARPDTESTKVKNTADSQKAMDHYLSGLAEQAKGNSAGAIIEFQDALQYEQSASIYFSLGQNYFALNKLSLSLVNARRAYELDSLNTEYGYLLQDIYTAARLNDSAMIVLNNIIARDSTAYNAYYRLAQLCEGPKPTQAIAIYKRLIKGIGSEWTVLQRIAELYERLGDLKGCITTLDELRSMDPGNVDLELLMIEFLSKDKQSDKALLRLDDLLLLYPDNLNVIERKAQILIQNGKWKEAAESYKKAFADSSVSKEAKVRIGVLYFASSLKDSALLPIAKEILAPLDNDTTDWEVKMYLGAIAMAEKKDSVAINYFHMVTEIAPWNAEAWFRLGGLYFDNRKYSDAIKVLTPAIDKFPEEFPINIILGLSYMQSDDYKSAEKYLEKAVSLNDSDLNALASYGYTLSKLNKTADAITCLKKALAVDKNNVDIMSTLGLIYDDKEMWTDCDSLYPAALAIDSTNALINNNYAYSLSKRSLRLEEALRMVTISLEKEPANSSYLDTKGWIYYQMGQYEEARTYIQKSLDISGNKSVILDHLGDVLYKMGKKTEAINTWKQALETDKENKELQKKIERGLP
ncbi:MAG: tetratricopeptide repeat protein [Ignavibacteriales bacterium]|nr:tetratricopeptide repeat protein [Ignavibacteriales bacterium]